MLSKIWFCVLALACGCRLGTPRPDGSEGPTGSAVSGPNSAAHAAALAPSSTLPAPVILTLPTEAVDSASAPDPSSAVATGSGTSPAASASVPSPAEAQEARRHRIAVIGDSLSDARVGGGGYLRALSQSCPDARIENLAKGGFMVNQMRRRFEATVLPRLPADFNELIVFGGVNDLYSDETAGRTFAKISADLGAIYRAAKARGARVIALTVTPWGGFSRYYNPRRAAATRELNQWIRAQKQSGLVDVVIDANPLLACGNAERLCPEYELPFHDGIHFGKLGQQKLGEALAAQAFADCQAPASPNANPGSQLH